MTNERKKIKNKKLSLMILVLLAFQIILINEVRIQAAENEISEEIITLNSLKPIDNITINSDSDFITYGFPGYGNETHPYLIEEYNITSNDQRGIYIRQTTFYFIIQGCYIHADTDGISFSYVASNTAIIRNNTIVHNSNRGIQLMWTEGCLIENNTFYDNSQALYTREAHHTIFRDNMITDCTSDRPVFIFNSEYCLIDNNEVYGTEYDEGIGFRLGLNSNITNNRIYNGGFYIEEYYLENFLLYNFENNYVNNRPLGFFRNQDALIINQDNYGQLLVFNCSNADISNVDIEATNYAIKMLGSHNAKIHNCNLDENGKGIDIQSSNYVHIFDNHLDGNNRGLSLEDTWFIKIENNVIDNTENEAIIVAPSETSIMAGVEITGNIIQNCKTGVDMYGQNYSLINGNVFYGCSDEGVLISLGHQILVIENVFENNRLGLVLEEVTDCKVRWNNLYENYEMGVRLYQSSNNTITNNILANNAEIVDSENFAIVLNYDSDNNTIYHNVFYNNSVSHPSQARDEGTGNLWYSASLEEGNVWSDWSIGSYYIYTEGDPVFDHYPLTDIDKDLINDLEEFVTYGTNPFDDDSDDDYLTDGEEILDYGTSPTDVDSDDDGLIDGEEVLDYGTNPLSEDSDGDTMDDYWEVTYGTDPLANDATKDPDRDKLTNIEEYDYGTDPLNDDTDGDGHSDSKEIRLGTDPLDASDYPPFPVAAVVGGITGGVILIGGSIAAVFYMRKKEILFFKKK